MCGCSGRRSPFTKWIGSAAGIGAAGAPRATRCRPSALPSGQHAWAPISPPFAEKLREAAHATRDVHSVHHALRARGEDNFLAQRPQTIATRIMEEALAPGVLGAVVARRLRRLCPLISEGQAATAVEAWRPTRVAVRPYAAHVFLRFPLNAWPADARMHPAEGMHMCSLGCPGSPDDLRHYVSCHRLLTPILRCLRMAPQPTWEQHLGLVGDLAQRAAAVWAWLAAFRTYMIVRHGDGVSLRDAVTVAADHARGRIPANVGVAARPEARARARARA